MYRNSNNSLIRPKTVNVSRFPFFYERVSVIRVDVYDALRVSIIRGYLLPFPSKATHNHKNHFVISDVAVNFMV